MVFVRARRSATIRTRMDLEFIRNQLTDLATAAEPGGLDRLIAHGYFTEGWVGEKDFRFVYFFNSSKNAQSFDVEGRITEEPEWRMLRIKVKAQSPWLEWWLLVAILGWGAFYILTDEIPIGGMIFVALFLVLFTWFANFLYIPDVVARRVSALLASEVRGSVKVGAAWVVPERE